MKKKILLSLLALLIYCTLNIENCRAQWVQITNGMLGIGVSSIGSKGDNIYAGTLSNGIYLSSNYGNNWHQCFIASIININSIVSDTNFIFAGIGGYSIWKRSLSEIIGIKNISSNVTDKFLLYQNYPNPFNPATNIRYQITNNKLITLKIYDMLGKEVATLVNEKQSPGTYEVSWDGSNYPSGVYLYQLSVDNVPLENRKMVLVK